MIKLILAVALVLGLTACSSKSVPKGFTMSPFLIIDSGDEAPSKPAPVEDATE